ncbi:hypothetical protein E6C70_08575 [Glaciibacter flavus]|uniref:Uncharacterized protein n=1 Tax=Orlajensenia flava TaxID=2565934 RepID=A0A4S4FU39_9MICO|nr:hypothetical protein [Glaciibacter flavus]THG34329.1 hypothetical protein E6C70_08575 [Glaciibacter flavus]
MPITLDQNDLRVRKQLVKLLSAPRWSMRLPTRVNADRFISATREDRELRLMVLNDLRIRSAPRAPMMGYAAIAVALVSSPVAAAFAFSLNARVIDALGFRVLIDLCPMLRSPWQ